MGTQLDKPVRKLREWQKDALDVYFEKPRKDFLALVTPGGGKTIFALTLATLLESVDRIVVVCPSVHIKSQWESAAEGFGIDLDSASITTTYQQVASTPEFFAELMAEMPTLVIFDEIHHASDSNSWGKRILEAFQGAEARVCLTGTAFRSDTDAIPFVVYENEVCCPDYVFGYGQAANSEPPIVRLLEWPVFDGEIGWRREGEEEKCRRFSDRVRGRDKVARLSACLNPEGGFMHSMLTAANDCLNRFPGEAALAICKDCKHADAVADAIARITGAKPSVVHSKDEMAAAQLEAFRDGTDRWIVSVKMLSEGVDVPRLRVLVYATNTCTEMFFRQAMGRIVRGTGPAICYLPAHPPFLKMVQAMHMERLHDITKKEQAISNGGAGGMRGKVGSIEALSSEGWEQRVERVRIRRKEWAKDSPAIKAEREARDKDLRLSRKERYQTNWEDERAKYREYYQRNRDLILEKKSEEKKTPEYRERRSRQRAERWANDPEYRALKLEQDRLRREKAKLLKAAEPVPSCILPGCSNPVLGGPLKRFCCKDHQRQAKPPRRIGTECQQCGHQTLEKHAIRKGLCKACRDKIPKKKYPKKRKKYSELSPEQKAKANRKNEERKKRKRDREKGLDSK